MCESDNAPEVIDLRKLIATQGRDKMFQIVEELDPKEALILADDRDPKQLYDRLSVEYPEQFSWTFLESGPVWRIEISRLR